MNSTISIIFAVIYYTAAILAVRRLKPSIRSLTLCGIMIAMTLVLEAIQIPLPTGTTMPLCSPVPLIILAVMTDKGHAVLSGFICGILAMLLIPAWQPIHFAQFFVEHMVCFSCFGFAAIFGTDKKWKILLGTVLAFILKTAGHLISGVLFFSKNAWDGWGAWGYSLGLNMSMIIPLTVICCIIVILLPLEAIKKQVNKTVKEKKAK